MKITLLAQRDQLFRINLSSTVRTKSNIIRGNCQTMTWTIKKLTSNFYCFKNRTSRPVGLKTGNVSSSMNPKN